MYSFLKQATVREKYRVELPSLSLALIVAEFLYKFHSFTLECVAFLATWYVFSAVVSRVDKLIVASWPERDARA
ncbi:MAG: hypothetical protein SH809_09325 [Rhodothermales bacterium]|nr:hypothetical protein [Rhodothermales bacterium]